MRPLKTCAKDRRGYALVLTLVVSTMLLVGAGSLLMVRQQWAYTATRSHQRDVASIALRNASAGFEETVRTTLRSQQQLLLENVTAPPFIDITPDENADWADEFTIGTPRVSPATGSVVLKHTSEGLTIIGSTTLDPFQGLQSSSQAFAVSLQAEQNEASGVQLTESISTTVRQMPVSQFNLFSVGNLSVSRIYVEGGTFGRVFANGSLALSDGVFTASWLPVAAAGHVLYSGGAKLVTTNTPEGVSTSSNSVTAREWCSLSRGTYGMSILAVPDGISPVLTNGGPLAALTANNTSAASLRAQCALRVNVNGGGNLVVTDGTQASAFKVQSVVEDGVTVKYLVFNYSQLLGSLRSVYIETPKSDDRLKNVKVVVYKARALYAPLSIVTPNDLIIADGFNDLSSSDMAASLTVGGKIEAATEVWAASIWN